MSDLKLIDVLGLYEVRTYTDTLVGDIRMLRPVTAACEPDVHRVARFFGSVTLTAGMQQFPTSFEIEAVSLAEAIAKCPDAAVAAGEAFKQRIESQRVQQAIMAPGGVQPTRQ